MIHGLELVEDGRGVVEGAGQVLSELAEEHHQVDEVARRVHVEEKQAQVQTELLELEHETAVSSDLALVESRVLELIQLEGVLSTPDVRNEGCEVLVAHRSVRNRLLQTHNEAPEEHIVDDEIFLLDAESILGLARDRCQDVGRVEELAALGAEIIVASD